MRTVKKIILVALLHAGGCASLPAFSQSLDSAEYFFDADPGPGNGIPVVITPGDTVSDSIFINTAGIMPGFHLLYFRVKDTNNLWSLYEGGSIFLHDTLKIVTASIDSAEYFFNTDPGVDSANTFSIVPGDTILDTVSLSTAGLAAGFHQFFARVADTNSVWSLYEGFSFYLYDTLPKDSAPPISAAEYFFDADPGIGNGLPFAAFSPADSITATDTIPSAPLTAGAHYLYVRVRDTLNTWSLYEGAKFTVCSLIPAPDFSADTVCLYSITSFTDLTTNLDTSGNYTYAWDFNNDGLTDDTTEGNTQYQFGTPGPHTVSLIVHNTSGCFDTIVKTVYVDSLPVVTLALPVDTICSDDTLVLSGGNPAGGAYSGTGVYSGSFFADSVNYGLHTITYTYYTADSCMNTATAKLFVSPCLGVQDVSVMYSVSLNPNPFRETTQIIISGYRPSGSGLEFTVTDVFGREIRKLSVRSSTFAFSRETLAGGVYFYSLKAEGKIAAAGKMVITD